MSGDIEQILEFQLVEFALPRITHGAIGGPLPGVVAGVSENDIAGGSVVDGQAAISPGDHLHVGNVTDAVRRGVLHDAALNLCQSGFAAKRLQVIVDQLIGCRSGHRRQGRSPVGAVRCPGLVIRSGQGRVPSRFCRPAMACVTSDFLSTLEIVLIDGLHHRHHLTSHFLHRSARFAIRQMAVVAGDTERSFKKLHRRNQLVRRRSLHHLDVLENHFGLATGQVRRGVLGIRASGEQGYSQRATCDLMHMLPAFL